MTPWQAAGLAAQVAAAVSAGMLTRRRAEHRPAAVALSLLAAANLLDAPIGAALTPYPVEPWEGVGRVLVYLEGALSLSYYAIVAGLAVAVAVEPERRRRATAIVVAVWFFASVVLAALYPSPLVRGAGLQRIYFAADLIGLFVSTVALITWGRRSIAAKRSPNGASVVTLFLVMLDAGILLAPFSPWRNALFGADYKGIQFLITTSFAIVTIVQVALWKYSSRT